MKKTHIALLLILIGVILISSEYWWSNAKSIIIDSEIEDTPGNAPEHTYPVLLIPGFNPTYSKSISSFSLKPLQDQLVEDLPYRDEDVLTEFTTCTELHYSDKPITLRITYYEDFKLLEIEDYADNLHDIIERVKYCTGAEKVDIIAHSMGGIVSRYYLKHIDATSVRKLIMVGTPNHGGVYNAGNVEELIIKNGTSELKLDFVKLFEDHVFIPQLNEGDETPGDVHYYTIEGKKDDQGDGRVFSGDVSVEGEKDHVVVPCEHTSMIVPQLCPEGFEAIKQFLTEE